MGNLQVVVVGASTSFILVTVEVTIMICKLIKPSLVPLADVTHTKNC